MRQVRSMQRIDLYDCQNITKDAIKRFKLKLPIVTHKICMEGEGSPIEWNSSYERGETLPFVWSRSLYEVVSVDVVLFYDVHYI
uniref:Uncharacterized protein n=1 Tax=Parascaris equorum TaxID=6256 RepID=A0A914RMK5_PAREQ